MMLFFYPNQPASPELATRPPRLSGSRWRAGPSASRCEALRAGVGRALSGNG